MVEDVLRSHAASNPKDWSRLLPFVEFAMNNCVHASTGMTPFYVNSLRHPRTPAHLIGLNVESTANVLGLSGESSFGAGGCLSTRSKKQNKNQNTLFRNQSSLFNDENLNRFLYRTVL